MIRIACLHTAESNIAVFDTALRTAGMAGVELHHTVRADLLAAVEDKGRLTPATATQTADILRNLAAEADAVLLTCSTLGPAADGAIGPIMRVDAALAAEAVEDGGTVVVLCAAETTVDATRSLFEAAARRTGAAITVRLIPGAWQAFKAGDHDRYLRMIAQAADEALLSGAARVALAQASMAGACDLASGHRVLNSPAAGLRAAVRSVTSRER